MKLIKVEVNSGEFNDYLCDVIKHNFTNLNGMQMCFLEDLKRKSIIPDEKLSFEEMWDQIREYYKNFEPINYEKYETQKSILELFHWLMVNYYTLYIGDDINPEMEEVQNV